MEADTKTYTFKVVIESDDGGFHAYCPALRSYGAVTQGATEEEALQHINEVVQMVVDELIADGLPIPSNPQDVRVFQGMHVSVIPTRIHA